MRLSGKRLLVVGASSRLGEASARATVREGARVCFAARRIDRISAAAQEAGNGSFAPPCDVRDESSCRAVVADAAEAMGGLDGVVYAPGIATFGRIVQRWQERDYLYGRAMDVSAVAEQVVNALCATETIRRIAITPSYR